MKTTQLLTLLTVLLVTGFSTAFAADKPDKPAKAKRVNVAEFDKIRQGNTNLIIDVRTEREFKAGHIPGAINIDVNGPDFEKKIAELDKTKTYLVHCQAGRRSANACEKMSKAGFTSLIDLAPGFRGWTKAGKPVEK